MSQQITQERIQSKNEAEISKSKQYAEVYRKIVSQMAKNSQEEYF